MEKKTRKIIGWVLSGLVLLFMAGPGMIPKFIDAKYQADFATGFPNYPPAWVFGLVILLAAVLYLIPRTQVIGFALMTGYLGGSAAIALDMYGAVSSLMVFGLLVVLWIGQAFLRPSLLSASSE